jgi:two-component system response regulator FixJ
MIAMPPADRKPVSIHDAAEAKRCAKGRVVLIDDDPDILASLATLLELSGYMSECHASAALFLQAVAKGEPVYPGPCCVVSDIKMPDIDGLELVSRLQAIEELPLILMSGGSGIREAIDAFKLGVVDFLVKPFEMDAFLTAISKGLAINARAQVNKQGQSVLQARVRALTPREREVVSLVAVGRLNREVADQLAISERMVKMHRQSAMEKLKVKVIVHAPHAAVGMVGSAGSCNPLRAAAMTVPRYCQAEAPRRRQVSMTLARRAKARDPSSERVP